MIKWGCAVITSPRPGPDTLKSTLASVQNAGFTPVVCMDEHKKLGAWGNWLFAASVLVRQDFDYVMIVEDDVELSVGLRDYLDFYLPPDGIASLYSAAPNDSSDSLFGWIKVKVPNRAYGALAYVMRLHTMAAIAADPPFPDRPHGTDHNIGTWCKRQGGPYHVHAPSFAVHRGAFSTLPDAGNPECRQCRRWVESIAIRYDVAAKRTRTIAQVVDVVADSRGVANIDRKIP